MARCEEGYLCDVCGDEVADLRDSELYLRYILGELDIEQLHSSPERHLVCNPVLAQFIAHQAFPAVSASGPLAKELLDSDYVTSRSARVTAAYTRLLELDAQGGDRDITSYPPTPTPSAGGERKDRLPDN
jgi:hypothetical protein